MIRVVIDTNIFISGTFWNGSPRQIILEALRGTFLVISSQELLQELEHVLAYNKFAHNFAQMNTTPAAIFARYQHLTVITEVAEVPDNAVRDLKDVMLLASAVGGKADYLITGDNDLLAVGVSYQGVVIITPSQFLEVLSPKLLNTDEEADYEQ